MVKKESFSDSFCIWEIMFDDVSIINSLCLFKGEPHQIMNKVAIESAIGNQYQPYSRPELAYVSVYKSLIINHGFMNGNKRTAVIVLYIASVMIGNELRINDEVLANLTYKIACEGGGRLSVEEIANQVFKQSSKNTVLNKNFDIVEIASEFIENHKWLIEELAK